MSKRSPFRYFKTSPEIIRLAVLMDVRSPISLRNVEDLLHGRGVDGSHETVRFGWHRFGPMAAPEIRKRRVGEPHDLWRAVDLRARCWKASSRRDGTRWRC